MIKQLAVLCAVGLGFITPAAAGGPDKFPPCEATQVTVTTGTTTACVSWFNNSSGDDCYLGLPTCWELRQSTSPITDLSAVPVVARGLCVGSTDQGHSISGLNCNTTYYWALSFIDDVCNVGPPALRSATTLACGGSTEVACDNDANPQPPCSACP